MVLWHYVAFSSDSHGFCFSADRNTFEHPRRVFDSYSEQEIPTNSSLKVIFVLGEPIAMELSLYNMKKKLFLESNSAQNWYSDVVYSNGTIMPFDDYAVKVMKPRLENKSWKSPFKYADHLKWWFKLFDRSQLLILHYDEIKYDPPKAQWRIETFLSTSFSEDLHASATRVRKVPRSAGQLVGPLYEEKNLELYELLESYPGLWMEQNPFPHFNISLEKEAQSNKLIIPNVLLIGAQKAGTSSVSLKLHSATRVVPTFAFTLEITLTRERCFSIALRSLTGFFQMAYADQISLKMVYSPT